MKIIPTGITFRPNAGRVLNRALVPKKASQISSIINRVLSIGEAEVEAHLATLRAQFEERHLNLESSWLSQFESVKACLPNEKFLSASRRLLIGAFFTAEYAIESAALTNPSIVPHPDQTGLGKADLRFILTLRAIGEGHISSIEFRSGVVRGNYSIEMDEISALVAAPQISPDPSFPKSSFLRALNENGLENNWSRFVLNALGSTFTRTELDESMHTATKTTEIHDEHVQKAMKCMYHFVDSNYEVSFDPSFPMSQRVLFPLSVNESNGMEDARFVRFIDEDQSTTYYASYTAFDGRLIIQKLIGTSDFLRFRIHTLTGVTIQNKGMALFPRRIEGQYAMLSRHDDENIHLLLSDDLYLWNDSVLELQPVQPWEFVKIGNCGSPIETEAGWLVITHGVGPMRKYCIGALLLDLRNPQKVLGRLDGPLLEPTHNQRDGYVPNVVYTCGALIHRGRLILPYGLNDTTTTIMTIELEALLAALIK
jgi:predicted GH43/DUF377 family glycosyl hydrolase